MRAATIMFVLAACGGSDRSDLLDPEAVVITDLCGGAGIPLTVDAIDAADDTLYVHWHAFGGCNDHAVYACWNGSFDAGYFPIATITLGHDDFEDQCDGVINGTSEFALDAVLAANHGQTVELLVDGHRTFWPR